MRINGKPTSGHIRAAVVTTEDVRGQHPSGFPAVIPEGLPLLGKMNHEIRLMPGRELGNLTPYSIPERWVKDISVWIIKKVEPGIIKKKPVHGRVPMFAPGNQDKILMRQIVNLAARNEITIKHDKTILNQRMILNSGGCVG